MDLGLEGRVALVGAASKGIGRAIAAALAAEGAHVAVGSGSRGRTHAEGTTPPPPPRTFSFS
ncbi:MAG: SDR family oxidoreductase, partial [Thermoleophilaceae bacterium]